MGKNPQDPSNASTLGGCLQCPTYQDSHQRLVILPRMCKIPSSTVFGSDAGEALKYYITNTLKKPNRVSIRQFFVRVEQLNSYLETLPCLFYSSKENPTTKEYCPCMTPTLRLTYCACVQPGGRPSMTCPRIPLRSAPGRCYLC